jgi:glycosyltransferase involved in cell wall biosynthesis
MNLSTVSTWAGTARDLYRRLPVDMRRRVRPVWLPIWNFVLGAAMPDADPRLRRTAHAAAIVGLMRAATGLGAAARLLGLELVRSGVAVRAVDVTELHGLPLDAPADPAFAGPEHEGEAVILHLNPPTMLQVSPWLDQALAKGKRLIGYWTWELERAPAYWRNAARKVHEIWAPSRFAADAIARTAPDAVVHVAPHPVAAAPTIKDAADRLRMRAALGAAPSDFVVLTAFSMGSSMERKNPLAAITAFERAFSRRRDAVLVVRMREAGAYPEGAARVREAASRSRAQVRVIEGEHGWPDLPALYAACDAYLSLHRSEGFGLTIAEAALMERPVVTTAWSGNMEFLPQDYAGLVPAELIAVSDPQGIYRSGCRWADPDVDVAAGKLAELAGDAEMRAAWGKSGRAHAQPLLVGGAAANLLGMRPMPATGSGLRPAPGQYAPSTSGVLSASA